MTDDGAPRASPCSDSISVVIPLYNKEDTIDRAINSVLYQTYQNFEVIVIDDGSTDASAERIQVSDARIRLIHQQNAGASAARNRGAEEAVNELIAFLDADDMWLPDHLETLCAAAKAHPHAVAYFSRAVEARQFRSVGHTRKKKPRVVGYYFLEATLHPLLNSSNAMVKRSALSCFGGFPSGATVGEDQYVWAKLALAGDVVECPVTTTIIYEEHSARQTRTSMNYAVANLPLELPKSARAVGGRLYLLRTTVAHLIQAKIDGNKDLTLSYIVESQRISVFARAVCVVIAAIPGRLLAAARLATKKLRRSRL